jgi:multidrug efflux system membrane fusion protein
VIDDRPFKADLDSKQADVEKAAAALSIANVTYNRLVELRKENAVAQQDVDNAKGTVDQAEASLASTKADVESSRLNLEWCKVLSPIDGRVSYKFVTVGNLVNGGQGQATLLTTIQSVTPMYCYVDVDEHSVLKYQKLAEERKLTNARDGKVPCYVQLGNETGFPHSGFIDFVDNHVDPTTGTQRVRGVLDNKNGLLTPGFFARLTVPGSGRYQALLVPDNAIGTDQSQRNVLVVDKEGKVSARPVELGALFGSMRAITSGLSTDDLVIVNGQMHARPGATVKPEEEPIKLDAQAFADPGVNIARTIPSTQASATGPGAPSTQPAIGIR